MPFTDEQLRAIEHTGGHSLTYAVAGSGKTHMLVGRVLFLLEQGIPAERIRVLAFNREAAQGVPDPARGRAADAPRRAQGVHLPQPGAVPDRAVREA